MEFFLKCIQKKKGTIVFSIKKVRPLRVHRQLQFVFLHIVHADLNYPPTMCFMRPGPDWDPTGQLN